MITVQFTFVDEAAAAGDADARALLTPRSQTAGAAGLDLVAALTAPVTLPPGGRALIPTGVALALPEGFEGQIRPRSGLALRHGLTCLNSPGTIDADYRGEIKVLLINLGAEAVVVERGWRIAQLVVAPVAAVSLVPVMALDDTVRGTGGFGSTGQHTPPKA
jgi:dUTP pyrophosphatase